MRVYPHHSQSLSNSTLVTETSSRIMIFPKYHQAKSLLTESITLTITCNISQFRHHLTFTSNETTTYRYYLLISKLLTENTRVINETIIWVKNDNKNKSEQRFLKLQWRESIKMTCVLGDGILRFLLNTELQM